MHAPDHLLDGALSVTTAVVASGGIAYAAHRARRELHPQRLLLTAATTGFVFAAQMVNFPVLPGTSGHLIGASLAVALLGPCLAVLSVTLVLVVQSVVFADGGLTALGTNVALMALVGVAVATAVTSATRKVGGGQHPRTAAALGAVASVPIAAGVLAVLFAVGGVRDVPFGAFLGAMIGVHGLIGLGEAVITVAVLSLVLAVAPGLAAVDPRPVRHGRSRLGPTVLGGAAAVSAVLLSTVASTDPDGLEAVSAAYDITALTSAHALQGFFLAGYGEVGGLPVPLVGALGTALTVMVAALLMVVLDRRRPAPATAALRTG